MPEPKPPSLGAEFLWAPRQIFRSLVDLFRLTGWHRWALAAILLLAAGLRIVGVDRHPVHKFESLYQDEGKILRNAIAVMDDRRIAAHYPLALYRWLEPQLQLAKVLTFGLDPPPRGTPRNNQQFERMVDANPLPYFLLLRANMVLFSLALVAMLFAIARYLAGVGPALTTALLAALNPLFVIYSKMAYYDLPMTFWFVVTVCLLAWTWKHRSLPGMYFSVLSFIWTFCSKQNSIVLAPLLLATLVRVASNANGRRWYLAFKNPHFWGSLLAGVPLLYWTYPALFDKKQLATFVRRVSSVYYRIGVDEGPDRVRNWWSWLSIHWPSQAHWLVLLVLVLGLGWLLYRRRTNALAGFLGAATAVYYLVAGHSTHSIDRTMLPLIPGLCLGGAGLALLARDFSARRPVAILAWSTVVLGGISLLQNSLRYNLLITATDTRELALKWLNEHARPGDFIVREHYTPLVPRAKRKSYLIERSKKHRQDFHPVFEVRSVPSVTYWSVDDYKKSRADYIILSSVTEEKAEMVVKGERKTPVRYTKHPPAETLTRYQELRKSFENTVFSPKLPPVSLLLRGVGDTNSGPASNRQQGYLFNPDLFTLWLRHDEYVLGPTIEILSVKKRRRSRRQPDSS